jgi:methyl-accepting chemotaxis protein
VQQVAIGTDEVSRTVAGVTAAAGETSTAAGDVLHAANRLAEQSAMLRQQVDRFLATVRAA